jgi:hypothetical protein
MDGGDLFILAGGTMMPEAAVLGIPTLSIYQNELLIVDRYSISIGIITHVAQPSDLVVSIPLRLFHRCILWFEKSFSGVVFRYLWPLAAHPHHPFFRDSKQGFSIRH